MRATLLLLAAAAAGLAAGPYGDISGLKLNKPEDKEDVKSTPPPKDAFVLFDGKSLDGWTKPDGKVPAEWDLLPNGVPGDQSRLVWHLDLTSGSERVLTAESIYPDVPRLVVLVLAIVLFAGVVIIRSRGQRRNTPEPPIFTTPSQP